MNLFSLLGVSRKDISQVSSRCLKAMRGSMTKSNKDYVSHTRMEATALSEEERAKCPHLEWIPETRENGWRSYCIKCGQPAQGSCQG